MDPIAETEHTGRRKFFLVQFKLDSSVLFFCWMVKQRKIPMHLPWWWWFFDNHPDRFYWSVIIIFTESGTFIRWCISDTRLSLILFWFQFFFVPHSSTSSSQYTTILDVPVMFNNNQNILATEISFHFCHCQFSHSYSI